MFLLSNRRLTPLLCARSTAEYCCGLLTTETCTTGCGPFSPAWAERQVSPALTAGVREVGHIHTGPLCVSGQGFY